MFHAPLRAGKLAMPSTFSTSGCFELVARVARAMTPAVLAETEWVAIPRTTLRDASWPG